jgi:amino acid permease
MGEMVIVSVLTISLIICVFATDRDNTPIATYWRTEPFRSGFWGFADAWVVSTFAYDGADDIATTAGEASETRNNVKRTIYVVFIVLVLVYGVNNIFIGLGVEPTNAKLGKVSPFTIILESAPITGIAEAVNAIVILTISCMVLGYSYNESRMVRELAVAGRLPKVLSGLTSWGVPIPALLASMIATALVYGISFAGEDAFGNALAMSGILTLIDWIVTSVCLLRFRRAYRNVQERISPAAYLAPFFPAAQWALIVVCAVIGVSAIANAFAQKTISKAVMTLVGPVLIIGIFCVHKLVTTAKFVTITEIEDRLLVSDKGSDDSELSWQPTIDA